MKISDQENLLLTFGKDEPTLTDSPDATFFFEKKNDYAVNLQI